MHARKGSGLASFVTELLGLRIRFLGTGSAGTAAAFLSSPLMFFSFLERARASASSLLRLLLLFFAFRHMLRFQGQNKKK